MRTVSSFEYDHGFDLSVATYLADTIGRSKERRIAWYHDFANYVLFRYDQIVEQLVCICVVGEQWVFYEIADVPINEWNGYDQEWHTLEIKTMGNQLTALRDDEIIFQHSDSLIGQMPRDGYIILSNTYLATCFDDIWLTSFENPAGYICGDANADGNINISDAVYLINYVFVGGAPPAPPESGDANCDASANVSDAVWIINYIFIGGNAPCDLDNDGRPDC